MALMIGEFSRTEHTTEFDSGASRVMAAKSCLACLQSQSWAVAASDPPPRESTFDTSHALRWSRRSAFWESVIVGSHLAGSQAGVSMP